MSTRILRWLPRWLEIDGLDPRTAIPRGATTTIAELRALGPGWTETATIDGTITGLVGTVEGTRALLDDGTGTLVVFIRATVDTFRLGTNGSRVELDLRPFDSTVDVRPTFDPSGFEAFATAVRRDPEPA